MTSDHLIAVLSSPLLNVIIIPLLLWFGRSILAKTIDDIVAQVMSRLDNRIVAVEGKITELRHDFSAHDQVEQHERQSNRELLTRLVGLLERHYDDFKRLVDEMVVDRRLHRKKEDA